LPPSFPPSGKGEIVGRQSREHRERRERRAQAAGQGANQDQASRIAFLEEELKNLCEDTASHWPEEIPPDIKETNLEDVIAFESVGSGPSLFEGLQARGVELPPPDQLDEDQSAQKAHEVLQALARIRVFLIGFDHMSAREFYRTLWHQTLWEGCYIEKRIPGAHTIIDVSHQMPRSVMLKYLEDMMSAGTVH
jgi:hypothetical protein